MIDFFIKDIGIKNIIYFILIIFLFLARIYVRKFKRIKTTPKIQVLIWMGICILVLMLVCVIELFDRM